MENPFQNSNIETLKEAFPTVDVSIINDVLYSAQGDLNVAFDMLLDMNSSAINGIRTKPLPNAPPLPLRQSSSINNISHFNTSSTTSRANTQPNTGRISQTNPFLETAKPLTVREELAQWRQDLRKESRQRAAANVSSLSSTPNISFSSMFKSNSSRASLNNERNNKPNIQVQADFQRPLPSRPLGSLSGIRSSASTPNVNYQPLHSRSNSHPNSTGSASHVRSQQHHHSTVNVSYLPQLPNRRQGNISSTNPFYVGPVPPSTAQRPQSPQQQQNYQANSNHNRPPTENDIPSFNPFEEPELPPPAYSEIQRDTLVNLT
ncbi:hypothetical protein INT46_000630 [Mucor plumbeus]|uniref:CUE domain-containing protein n=1 Tax=Mucor plumbeus TaxID=97098 RepID=A0A8H7QZE8_9FUNG|nr:hypothetical protein INT46_000630 [Mucor plumbeus]